MRERWSYCCSGNEQDSGHGAAMQLAAREREAGDGFPPRTALREASFFSSCDVYSRKTPGRSLPSLLFIILFL
jgi:hypothetical protein